MRSLIVDDEASARSRLTRLLIAHPDIRIVGEAHDGLEAVTQIERLHPELLFLDVQMPGLTGFEVLHSLGPAISMPLVIFVTGYDQHALAAFDANALAYLLKPVEPERLNQALDRARRLHAFTDHKDQERATIMRVARESPRMLRHVVCRRRDRLLLVPPHDIFWFEIDAGIVRARTASESYWVNYQVSDLEISLPPEMFFRARRDVLVNISRIKEIRPSVKSGFVLIMSDSASTEIVVSERRAKPLRLRVRGL
jgi:two-component system, LytTR family, response regulator